MRILKKDATTNCAFCKPGAYEEAALGIKGDRSVDRYVRKAKLKGLLDACLVVASCDKPLVNEPFNYKLCGRLMCSEHVGARPQEGVFWCREHAVAAVYETPVGVSAEW